MKSILLFSLIAMTGACVDQPEDNSDVTITDTPRLAVNGMLPSQMQYTNLDQAPLTSTAIGYLAATSDGRAFLNYLVGCALDGTQSITANGYTFTGSVGLVTAWPTRSITLSERRWVSACIIARTNYIGTSQQVSIRGPHPALAVSSDSGYNKEEGAYYGDVFSGATMRRACSDPGTYDGSLIGYKGRRCSFEDANNGGHTMCGYDWDLDCGPHCVKVNGVYTSCTDTTNVTWNEVVKVHDL